MRLFFRGPGGLKALQDLQTSDFVYTWLLWKWCACWPHSIPTDACVKNSFMPCVAV